MPSGVYIRTEYHKKCISDGQKGRIGGFKGHHHSKESKLKISDNMKGKEFSEDHRKHISESRKGVTLSEKHKHNISIAMTGKKHSKKY